MQYVTSTYTYTNHSKCLNYLSCSHFTIFSSFSLAILASVQSWLLLLLFKVLYFYPTFLAKVTTHSISLTSLWFLRRMNQIARAKGSNRSDELHRTRDNDGAIDNDGFGRDMWSCWSCSTLRCHVMQWLMAEQWPLQESVNLATENSVAK